MKEDPSCPLQARLKVEFTRWNQLQQSELSTPPSPFDSWHAELTPPFPSAWPPPVDGPQVSFSYAYRLGRGISDGVEIAAPWARFERVGEAVHVEQLRPTLKPIGVQGVRPINAEEAALFDALKAAGGFEGLLSRAAKDPTAALLLRRGYCQWLSTNGVVGKPVLKLQPCLAAALDGSAFRG